MRPQQTHAEPVTAQSGLPDVDLTVCHKRWERCTNARLLLPHRSGDRILVVIVHFVEQHGYQLSRRQRPGQRRSLAGPVGRVLVIALSGSCGGQLFQGIVSQRVGGWPCAFGGVGLADEVVQQRP